VRYLYLSAERLREARRSEGQAAGGADRGDAGTYQKGEWRAPATLSLPHDPYICGPADLPAANAETNGEPSQKLCLQLEEMRKNEDPRLSFSTPEFKEAQRIFTDGLKVLRPSAIVIAMPL